MPRSIDGRYMMTMLRIAAALCVSFNVAAVCAGESGKKDGGTTIVSGRDVTEQLSQAIALAKEVRERAYVPYSRFKMGAVVGTDQGILVPGTLVENVSLGLAMCAERVALHSTVALDAGRPRLLVLVSPRTDGKLTFPCGACLQVAQELGGADMHVEACDLEGTCQGATLGELAPHLPHKK